MNTNYFMGVGLIAKAIGELIVDKNFNLAFTDFMKGLGSFGIDSAIKSSMEAPDGHVAAMFQAPPKIKTQP